MNKQDMSPRPSSPAASRLPGKSGVLPAIFGRRSATGTPGSDGAPEAGPQPDRAWLIAKNDPLRRLGFWFALIFIFLRFSMLHELITYKLGFNTYMLYLVGPPALFLLLFTGGIQRAAQENTARFWMGFTLWMVVCIPFSYWPGGSWDITQAYIRTEIPMLFLAAGMVITIADCYKVIGAVALAAVVNVYMARFFETADIGGRFNIAFSSIANANDMAAHLLLVLPLVAFFVIGPKQMILLRALGGAVIAVGLYLILGTGSRGALLSMVVMCVVALWKGTNLQRAVILVAAPVALLATVPFLPRTTTDRLLTIFQNSESDEGEARDSRNKRMHLLKQSIKHTLTHPLLGVGPNQFRNYEGNEAVNNNRFGQWQVSHNAYTQISSEMGLPGFFCMLGGTFGTFLILSRLNKRLRQARDCLAVRRLRSLCFLLLMAQVSFCTSIFFLSLGYRFYLPFLSGFVIALQRAVKNELPAIEQTAAEAARKPLPVYGSRLPQSLRTHPA